MRERIRDCLGGLAFWGFVLFVMALVEPRPDVTYASKEAERMKALADARMRAIQCEVIRVSHERMCKR